MKHIVEIHGDSLVSPNGGCARDKLWSNFKIYCKKRGHIKNDYYKLQNKERLAANQNGK